MPTIRPLAMCALAALPLLSVETRFWQQGEFADIEKGTLNHLSVRSDGRLSLAPAVRELLDSSTPYLWAVAQDSKGNLYAGGGGPTASTAKLFQIDPQGKSKVLAEIEGLEIHAIAVDSADRVYAATSPDGKVYRVTNGKSEVFFDPKAKYIWALAFSRTGDLLVATGDRGEVFRVAPDGKGSLFFATEETHARSLAIDKDGNLIVGTEPGGVVLRVTPAGEGFVLYQAAKREVTAVAVAADGSIYAAAVGNKPPATSAPPSSPTPTPPPASPPTAAGQLTVAPAKPSSPSPSASSASLTLTGGTEVYRIYPDGSPRKVWSHAQQIAYAITFDRQGRPLIGTGNKGDIYRLESDLDYTRMVNLAPTQVTGFAAGRAGQIFAVTGNIGKLYQVGPELEKKGTFESDPFDAGAFTYWGRVTYVGDLSGGRIGLEARSGNVSHPQKNWSPWSTVVLSGEGGPAAAPPARFLQYRLTIEAAPDGRSPEVRGVEIAHMAKNLAPLVREIELTPVNYKFSTSAVTVTPSSIPQSITLPAMGSRRSSATVSLDLSGGAQSMSYSKGGMGARWLAQDDNGDALISRVEIRGVNEAQWKLLRDNVRERHLGWDGTAFPDGNYLLRVTVSDSPSNPPDQALKAELVSSAFQIDNTPPRISGLAASITAAKVNAQWKAADALSIIVKAEYSVNGGEWIVVEPATRLSDSSELDYKLAVERPAGAAECTIAVRVTDEYDNQAVEKVVVR